MYFLLYFFFYKYFQLIHDSIGVRDLWEVRQTSEGCWEGELEGVSVA